MYKVLLFQLLITVSVMPAEASRNRCNHLFAAVSPNFAVELGQIKSFIAENGGRVTVVLSNEGLPANITQAQLEYIYGAKVILVGGAVPEKPKKIPGAVLHIGDAIYSKQFVVGEMNLLTGWGDLINKFDDKVFESQWAVSFDPLIMPESLPLTHIKGKLSKSMLDDVAELKRKMVYDPDFEFKMEHRDLLADYLSEIIHYIHHHKNVHDKEKFANGAVIKHAREFQTADSGSGIIKTNKIEVKRLVEEFMAKFNETRQLILRKDGKRKRLSYQDLDENKQAATFDKRWTLVQSLLFGQFDELMAQELLPIKREIRLDVVRGNVINIVDRFDGEWGPKEEFEKARDLVNNFFRKLPTRYRLLSGGVDVAILEGDGRAVVIDFNFGAFSGFIDAVDLPVSANMYISNLIGKHTPFLQELAAAAHLSPPEQERFIAELKSKLNFLSDSAKSDLDHDIHQWWKLTKP